MIFDKLNSNSDSGSRMIDRIDDPSLFPTWIREVNAHCGCKHDDDFGFSDLNSYGYYNYNYVKPYIGYLHDESNIMESKTSD